MSEGGDEAGEDEELGIGVVVEAGEVDVDVGFEVFDELIPSSPSSIFLLDSRFHSSVFDLSNSSSVCKTQDLILFGS